ncbi:uncharacterized protein LOC141706500 [Apium graveolens]|uniref:uncharacterized protein LOC141706500 n=1 Tax=Apium graveolens TaxID=4045 RepID=UPI003D7B998B
MGKGFILPAGFVGSLMYVVEFQKQGLPHVHMLTWLDSASRLNLQANIEKFVSVEISNPETDPVGYAAVDAFMVHGPCGQENPKSPCMKFCNSTTFDQSGFPIYRRRQSKITVTKGKANLDNQWVVPYNRDLLVKYQYHMNVEICEHARSLKYLFKYCLKGHDIAIVEIRGKKRQSNNGEGLNHYVWNDKDRVWNPHKRGKKIGRLSYTHHSAVELWFLRLLLTKVRGATSYESLRTVKGQTYNTFQEACKEYDLLDDDNEWHMVLSQCSESGFPPQIRQLFVHIMVNCKVPDLGDLWKKHWTTMMDDLLLKQQQLTGNPHLMLNEIQ